VIHGLATIFAARIGMAASWDPSLAERGQASPRRRRAVGIHWTFAPMVDIAGDPQWGRIVKGGGEDPYLGSAVAAAQARGFQGQYRGAPGHVIAEAVELARGSDVAIVVVGPAQDMARENASRSSLDLPGRQQELLDAVVATGKPVVVCNEAELLEGRGTRLGDRPGHLRRRGRRQQPSGPRRHVRDHRPQTSIEGDVAWMHRFTRPLPPMFSRNGCRSG